MKKIYILLIFLISLNSVAFGKERTFTKKLFLEAQKKGKTVVVNSWNKSCSTCTAQSIILDEAKNEFKNVLFLSFEQTVDTDVAKFLDINYWTTIAVYKDNKLIDKVIGAYEKDVIYSLIQKGI